MVAQTSEVVGAERRKHEAVRILVPALAVCTTLGSMGASAPYVALPAITEAFGVSLESVQWVVTVYLLVLTACVVAAGRLSDMFGDRQILLTGIGVFMAASIACAAAPSFWILLAGRATQGAGAAVLMALPLVIARRAIQKHELGRVMGLLGTMSAIGTALGPSVGGLLTAQFGWRAIFLALIVVSVGSFVLVLTAVSRSERDAPTRLSTFDVMGAVLLGATVSFYALALSGAGAGYRYLFGVLALLGFVLFVLVELRAEAPIVPFQMLADRKLSIGLISNMLTSTVLMATLVVGPFYLAHGLSLGPSAVGLVVAVGPIIAALSGVPAGRLVDRFGGNAVLVTGLVQMTTACVVLALLPRSSGIFGYVATIAILTSGYQLFLAANNTAIMLSATDDRRGMVSGLLTLTRNLGLVTGASLMGGIFAAVAGSPAGQFTAEAVTLGMHLTFGVATVGLGTALVTSLSNRRSH